MVCLCAACVRVVCVLCRDVCRVHHGVRVEQLMWSVCVLSVDNTVWAACERRCVVWQARCIATSTPSYPTLYATLSPRAYSNSALAGPIASPSGAETAWTTPQRLRCDGGSCGRTATSTVQSRHSSGVLGFHHPILCPALHATP